MGPPTLTGFAFLYGFTRNYRSQPMPNQLEGFKLADRGTINTRQILWLMWGATVIGLLIGFVAFLHAGYRHGSLGTWRGQEAFSDLQRWLTLPNDTDWRHLGFFGFGITLTLTTLFMRLRFIWWQLHPLAYPLAGNWNFGRLFLVSCISGVGIKIDTDSPRWDWCVSPNTPPVFRNNARRICDGGVFGRF